MSAAGNGVTLASGRWDVFQLLIQFLARFLLLRFLPVWLQLTIFGLVLTAAVTVWAVWRARANAGPGAAAAEAED
ncbi:hypothetical protein OG453_18465 [Streptomyces sp. NBC_01381]|uniref:hypothetical protein n=1 Tax=Streptomyces sp. NBC_01381 TaxID=2903845 RepID=UPI00225BAEB0|nr:hypothetical protein [Streptomyces sp. NBC_01381]MCX4668634.1 hypothetical protein [Streptomyces sp. NBC_01381]